MPDALVWTIPLLLKPAVPLRLSVITELLLSLKRLPITVLLLIDVVDKGEVKDNVAVPAGLPLAFAKFSPKVAVTETGLPFVDKVAVAASGTEIVRDPGTLPELILTPDEP